MRGLSASPQRPVTNTSGDSRSSEVAEIARPATLFQSLQREDGAGKRAAERKDRASLQAQLALLRHSEVTSPGKLMVSRSSKQPV